jgi:ketosteroid isomerase-like protein
MTTSRSAAANVEVTRQAIDAFNRRDLEAMLELAGENFVYDWSRSLGPNRGIYEGVEGFTEFVDDQWSMFEEFRVEPHEFVPCGERHVLVSTTVHARGRGGVPVSAKSSHLYTFEDGRLVRVTLYQERDEALAAGRA